MTITRRQFLEWSATGMVAASVSATCSSTDSQLEGELDSVIVIGAGLSGLVSAYMLSRWRTQVTVLEANEHPGGRVHTERWPNGQISELGFEEFFEKDVYPDIWWLIDELGLQDEVTPYTGAIGAFLRGEYVGPRGYDRLAHCPRRRGDRRRAPPRRLSDRARPARRSTRCSGQTGLLEDHSPQRPISRAGVGDPARIRRQRRRAPGGRCGRRSRTGLVVGR